MDDNRSAIMPALLVLFSLWLLIAVVAWQACENAELRRAVREQAAQTIGETDRGTR